jgi:hypothetical protein
MNKSTSLASILQRLETHARALGLNDTAWAARAGVRKETLSRLRSRQSCDVSTLQALAEVVGVGIGVVPAELASQGRAPSLPAEFPTSVERDFEEELVNLCSSGTMDLARWQGMGNGFFMGGVAVMLASVPEFDRRTYLDLGERLHPGISQVGVFALWLARSPVRPSRFLPMVVTLRRHAA